MNEASKAYLRRSANVGPYYHVITGDVLDVGCGHDLMPHAAFPRVTAVRGYDLVLGHKDAQTLPEVADEGYDTVHSSHCLEHMRAPIVALFNWLRVLRPGGYLVVTVPDWVMYEHRVWPSQFNSDHKWAFTIGSILNPNEPHVLSVPLILNALETLNQGDAVWCRPIYDNYDFSQPKHVDQTLGKAECAIEFVFRKADA